MAQNQHYVPQSVLRRFSGADGLLCVYDKRERRVFRTSPRNVAAEGGFYDLDAADGSTYSLEMPLSQLESAASVCIDKILQRQELGFLSASEKRLLAEFSAVQFIRIKSFRERFKDMSKQLVERLRQWAPSGTPEQSIPTAADDHEAKVSSLQMIIDSSRHLAPHFYNKIWLLHIAPEGNNYWISDNPVALHNSIPPPVPFLGNLGIAVPGIEIYVPLSSGATLSFLCPTFADKILQSHDDVHRLTHMWGAEVPSAESIGYLADGLRFGYGVPSIPENMDFANSLQVANAERFIFSGSQDFDLVEKMLDDHPDLTNGPRMQIG